VHWVTKIDRLNDGPIVPEFADITSNSVAESFAVLMTLILRMTGAETLNREGEITALESIDTAMPPDAEATPELDLQRALLSENQ
jgi:hypothetical protein